MELVSLCCKGCGEELAKLVATGEQQQPVQSSVLCWTCADVAFQKRKVQVQK